MSEAQQPMTEEFRLDCQTAKTTPEDKTTLILSELAKLKEELASLKERIEPTKKPYLTAREAAEYLRVSYSTFRKVARLIKRCPQTLKYQRQDLDDYANSVKPRKKR